MKIKTKKGILIAMSIALALLTTNCKSMEKDKNKDSFVWESTVTAPYNYPVQVLGGAFYRNKFYVKEVPSGQQIVDTGWGSSTGYNNGGFGQLPDSLDITWFSFAENKFYEGSFALPYDTIQQLFNTPIRESLTKRPRNYYEISVGMAPEGMVLVWVFGPNHNIEIGRFQAHEIPPIDLNEFLPSSHRWYDWKDRKAAQKEFADTEIIHNDKVRENLENKGLSPGLYDSYRRKYNIRITPHFEDKNAIVDEIMFTCFSGEENVFSLDELKDTTFHLRAPLKKVTVSWTFGRQMRYIRVTMDEKELFAIYEQMYQDDPTREIELRIEVSEKNNDAQAYFSQPGLEYPREIELEKSDIGIYPENEGNRHWITVFKDEYETTYPYNRKDGKPDGKE